MTTTSPLEAVERLRDKVGGWPDQHIGMPYDDARDILAHIDALAAERDAARAELAQWKAEIVAWLRGDEAQPLANTHPACMTDLAEAFEAGEYVPPPLGAADTKEPNNEG